MYKNHTDIKVLDIDLDFFLDHKATNISLTSKKRLNSKEYKPWKNTKVNKFFIENLGLNKEKKIKGKLFTHHVEVYNYIRELQGFNNNSLKFSIYHLDAHADLGVGDSSYRYISSEILALPIENRPYPQKINGYEGLSSGNFLSFLIANRWVKNLTYINRKEWRDDIPWFIFRGFDINSNMIELKQFSNNQIDYMLYGPDNMIEIAKQSLPLSIEPEVPFKFIDFKNFQVNDKDFFDLIFLTQSPNYTPSTADNLINLIKEYIIEN